MKRRHRYLLCAFLVGSAVRPALAQNPSSAVTLTRSSAAITLDGRLEEPAWQTAPLIELVQQSPRPGEPTPYKTEVRILVVDDRLYFGFLCTDPDSQRLAVHTMQRDGEMDGDDTLSIILDTYGDKRTGYFLQINAAGARADGLISDPESASLDWDGIWDARTARTEKGWSAEIEIPTRTLSFTPGLNQWGLNLERFVPRDRTNLRWASPTLDSFLFDLSRAGALDGAGVLEQGLGLEFSPYVRGRTQKFFGEAFRAWQGAAGGEVTWKVTPQMVVVFTANTDFAETEVDSRQINLTRFPLFFPEKRAFFLEGSNQFQFGLGLGQLFIPFFSRRIGLLEGEQIPINAGLKLNGRLGKWNLAALDVQTRATDINGRTVPGVNLLAGRVSYDVTSQLRLGTIFTHGDPEGLRTNTLTGFDAVWRTSRFRGNKNFLVGAWVARTDGDLAPGSRVGWGYKVDYPNDLWDCSTQLHQFGEALEPALGFLPRPGTRRFSVGCNYQPRPSKTGRFRWIRQEFFENQFYHVTNAQGKTESWRYFMAPVNVRLESGDRFEFNWVPWFECLAAPFEIAPGVVIPPGSYRFTRWRLEGETSPHRAWQVGSTTWFGTFYDGNLTEWENYVAWTSPQGRLQMNLRTINNFGHLKEGNFVQRLWQLQGAFAWNPNLILTSFIQYDTETQNLGTNTRLRWTLKPGNDLFIVWNRSWKRLVSDPREVDLVPESDAMAVKLRWTFRK